MSDPPTKDNARRAPGASRTDRHVEPTSPGAPRKADPLDVPLRELLEQLLAKSAPAEADPWVDPRNCEVNYREVLAAAKRDELKLFKVGRALMVRRSELDRWIALPQHRVTAQPNASAGERSPVAHILERAGYTRSAGGGSR